MAKSIYYVRISLGFLYSASREGLEMTVIQRLSKQSLLRDRNSKRSFYIAYIAGRNIHESVLKTILV